MFELNINEHVYHDLVIISQNKTLDNMCSFQIGKARL